MLPITSHETYQDGQVIFAEGNFGDWIYLIESGRVEISRIVDGSKVVVETLSKGDIFGEIAFLAGVPRTATATAKGETNVGVVDRDFLDTEYNKISQYFRQIIKLHAIRLHKMTEALAKSIKEQ
jgi:CRP/FNR family cyclic AMP-dependent transcriptional regulator